MKTTIQLITPEQAQKWLEKNGENPRKKIIISWVKELIRSLNKGEWVLTHQGIAFDIFGNLVDGQHRLTAIAISGISVHMMVTTGVPIESISEMDQGIRRNAATRMNVERRAAEPITFITKILYGNRPTTKELETIRDVMIDSCTALLDHCSTNRTRLSVAPVKAAFIFHNLLTGNKSIFKDYRKLVLLNMENIEELTKVPISIRALFSRLTGLTEKRSSAKVIQSSVHYIFAMTLFAIRNPDKRWIHQADTEAALNEVRKFFRNNN